MTARALVVDYGIGNVFSVCNALRAVGAHVELTGNPHSIRNADRILLPGVGAFARAMTALQAGGIADALRDFAASGRPFLGICIGMQVLMDRSTEFGDHAGLSLVPGEVLRVEDQGALGKARRVPHIGWATLQTDASEPHWTGTPLSKIRTGIDALYFVHSYHCMPRSMQDRLAFAEYDGTKITAAIQRDNIMGTQFHPERSGIAGQLVLRSFLDL